MKGLSNKLLKKFLTGKCSEQELDEINAFINASEENAEQLFSIEELYHLGKHHISITDQQIDEAEKKLFRRIRQEEAQSKSKLFVTKWKRYAAVITMILLVGGGLGYCLYSALPDRHMIVETASCGNVKKVILPDGTKVWLNNGTILKYPYRLAGKERRVHIEGEAYFEVTKNAKRPFIVESDAMQIKVLGTAFNFSNKKSCRIAKTSLIEGEIEVRGNNNEGMIILNPGQRAELNKSIGRFTVKEVNTRMDGIWRDNLIPFNRADLYTIIQTLERLYNVKIILSPDVSSDITYSGILKKQNSIEAVLHSLKNAIPIDYKLEGNNIYISPESRSNEFGDIELEK